MFERNWRNLPEPVVAGSLDAALEPHRRKTAVGDRVTVIWQHTAYTAVRNDGRDNRVRGSYFSKYWGIRNRERIN